MPAVPLINAETFIPELLSAYVETRRVDLGLPSADDLPFLPGIRDGVETMPCVVFYCDAFDMQHPERMSLTVAVTLINDRTANESADESVIAAQIRRALADVESFKDYISALSEEARTGWDITKYRVVRGGIEIDPELAQRRRATVLEIHTRTTETAVPQS